MSQPCRPGTSLEQAALSRASQHDLAIEGLGSYRAGADDDGHIVRAGLVIGYGRPPEHAYTTALARLCAVLPPELLPVPYPGPHPLWTEPPYDPPGR